jgi:hypothetical protein
MPKPEPGITGDTSVKTEWRIWWDSYWKDGDVIEDCLLGPMEDKQKLLALATQCWREGGQPMNIRLVATDTVIDESHAVVEYTVEQISRMRQ